MKSGQSTYPAPPPCLFIISVTLKVPPVLPIFQVTQNYISETLVTVIPNLRYQTGDCVKFDPGIAGFGLQKSVLDVTEIFDARPGSRGTGSHGSGTRTSMAWYMELRPLDYFSTTPGGYIPPTSQYTTVYTQLATNGYVGNLDQSVNTIQALADAVDRLPVALMSATGISGQVAEFSAVNKIRPAKLIGPSDNILTLKASAAATLKAAITAGKTFTLTATDNVNISFPNSMTFPSNAVGVLMNDGLGALSWAPGATPGGADTNVQYNDVGILGGDAYFVWDKTNRILTLIGDMEHGHELGTGCSSIIGPCDGVTCGGLGIYSGAAITVDKDGGWLRFVSGDGNGIGRGGEVDFYSGSGGDTGAGGAFNFCAGMGGLSEGNGGQFAANAGGSFYGDGGTCYFGGGSCNCAGNGGSIYFGGGQSNGGNGGDIVFTPGNSNAGGHEGHVRFYRTGNSITSAMLDLSLISDEGPIYTVNLIVQGFFCKIGQVDPWSLAIA